MSIVIAARPSNLSLAEWTSLLPDADRSDLIAQLTERQARELLRDWRVWARPSQLPPPGDWRFWLLMAGRGFGKTRTGAEFVCDELEQGRAREAMLIAATASDVRDVVVEGPSGIVRVAERRGVPVKYEPSKQRITWPNGAIARTRSADEPERIRGPECDVAWWDEFGTWKHMDSYTNADMGLRKSGPQGHRARCVVTFTPKPNALVRAIVKRTKTWDGNPADAVIRGGSTAENLSNLDPTTVASLQARYGGTRLGRQELQGELLEDVEGALWTLSLIDSTRLPAVPDGVSLTVVVVGVDPAATSNEESNETGIVVVALGSDMHGYVLDDRTIRGTPDEWARAVIRAYDHWRADHVTPETNNGGEMVTDTLRSRRQSLPVEPVHASRGKATRAEPVSALYEQGKVHHIGTFTALEDQMATWVPGDPSPDRMDALVWGCTDALAPLFEQTRRVWKA